MLEKDKQLRKCFDLGVRAALNPLPEERQAA